METKLYYYQIRMIKDEYVRTITEVAVKETPKRYTGINDSFRNPGLGGEWFNKKDIGKVFRSSFRHIDYVLVFAERNDELAIELLTQAVKEDYDKILNQLNIQNEALSCAMAAPINGGN